MRPGSDWLPVKLLAAFVVVMALAKWVGWLESPEPITAEERWRLSHGR